MSGTTDKIPFGWIGGSLIGTDFYNMTPEALGECAFGFTGALAGRRSGCGERPEGEKDNTQR